ncbi:MAG: MarR family transcriptional regulator [Oscillospiraceae bacterium]|nr:MarR family transcriptional regulator [Oscillospiraceae bacterium]
MKEKQVGFQIKTVGNLIRRNIDKSKTFKEQKRFGGAHGWAIGYLYDNRHRDVFQRDFESDFSIRRSTVTNMLNNMEKNGLIVRESVESDARLKKIVLTEKSLKIHSEITAEINSLEAKMQRGINKSEIDIFFKVIGKIRQNLEENDD